MELIILFLKIIHIIPFNTETNLNYVCTFNAYRSVNTLRLGCKRGKQMLYVEITVLLFLEDCIRHTNTLCVENVEVLNF